MTDIGVLIATVENNYTDQLPKRGPNVATSKNMPVDDPAWLYGFACAGAGAGAAKSASLITIPDIGSIQVR